MVTLNLETNVPLFICFTYYQVLMVSEKTLAAIKNKRAVESFYNALLRHSLFENQMHPVQDMREERDISIARGPCVFLGIKNHLAF